jgi:uncharacterized membrane protein YccC
MRQGYGLTKNDLSRIFGTILGGFIAFGILSFVHDSTIIGGLAIIACFFGFSFTPTNYKVGATFIPLCDFYLWNSN